MEEEQQKKIPSKRLAASQSFNEEEVGWLSELLTKLLSGGDVKMLMRAPAAKLVIRKIFSMKATISKIKESRSASAITEAAGTG